MTDDEPAFRIPKRPIRRYHRHSGIEYEGETVFTIRPDDSIDDGALVELVESILDRSPYRYGDWFDLPMPLYLVHDDRTGDTFRVAIRDGTVELHVLPETQPGGLRAFYDRLTASSERSWSVTCRSG
ncbi:MAG: hypothetical protein ACQET5_06595 [Halobacteriota archaeon]|uniref:hypothetical protein n=1 Tax=Natronomonas sp. TaxID=2184060 RepID=UPI0039764C8A